MREEQRSRRDYGRAIPRARRSPNCIYFRRWRFVHRRNAGPSFQSRMKLAGCDRGNLALLTPPAISDRRKRKASRTPFGDLSRTTPSQRLSSIRMSENAESWRRIDWRLDHPTGVTHRPAGFPPPTSGCARLSGERTEFASHAADEGKLIAVGRARTYRIVWASADARLREPQVSGRIAYADHPCVPSEKLVRRLRHADDPADPVGGWN